MGLDFFYVFFDEGERKVGGEVVAVEAYGVEVGKLGERRWNGSRVRVVAKGQDYQDRGEGRYITKFAK